MPVAAVRRGSAAIPEAAGTMPATSLESIHLAVEELAARKDAWAALPLAERIAIVDELRAGFARVAERWVALSLAAKGIDADEPAAGEEWITGPYLVLRNLRLLRRALEEIGRFGAPRIAGPVRVRPDGTVVARVFPGDLSDRVLFRGFTADVWMDPGVDAAGVAAAQAVAYRPTPPAGRVALVLGAGNLSSIAPMDALYKLFVELKVVVLKMNPVNAYLGPVLAEACRPLTDRGFLHVVFGGAEEGALLCRHERVDEVHITGSDRSHDAIVFGTGAEAAQRKAERRPRLAKPITSELGNVSPVIVVPGPWSPGDVEFHAANVATQLVNNAGFNCVSARVVVTWAGWAQRGAFLDAVRRVLAALPPRLAYYPGSEERLDSFLALHPDAERFGRRERDRLPWTLVTGLDPARASDICFTTEAFCGLMGETALAAPSVPEFVARAAEFVNGTVWGNLAAGVIVHPRTMRDPAAGAAVEQAITDLRYGTVSVNHWSAAGYALGCTPWGAHAGNDLVDVRSGIGVVHNTLMFSRVRKTVVRGPFRVWPIPPWFVTNRSAHVTSRRLAAFEAKPSFGRMAAVLVAALRG
ncbi:MAG TPA: aldehyde dehydrogenase family protein [Thermoanaerobaculaceae bacterium]|nr:aldehyde dehydrogenase family protein [Thermoanaerobaculaceae bacterium]